MPTIKVPHIKVALFDMAATTVDDMVEKPGLEEKLPLVISAYDNAFRKANIKMLFDELNDCRGRDKIEVFKEKVTKYRTDLSLDKQEELAQHLHDKEFGPQENDFNILPFPTSVIPHSLQMIGGGRNQ